jgi:hypothetical protein
MADPNAFALSLEMTLNDNASKVLEKIDKLTSTVEKGLNSLANKMTKFGDVDFSRGVSRQFKMINEDANKYGGILNDLSKKMIELSRNELTAPDVDEVAHAVKLHEELLDITNKVNLELELGSIKQEEADSIMHKANVASRRYQIWRQQSDKSHVGYQKLDEQLIKSLRHYETKTGIKLRGMEKIGFLDKFRFYNQEASTIKDAIGLLEKQERAALQAGKFAQAEHLKKLRDVVTKIGEVKASWDQVKAGVSGVAGTIGSVTRTIGLGGIADAASASGLYTAAIQKAGEQQERFHEAIFSGMDDLNSTQVYMKDISTHARKMATNFKFLQKEIEDAIVSMRQVGMARDQIIELDKYSAMLTRTTGANTQAIAQYSKMTTVAGMSTRKLTQQLLAMNRYAKSAGLSGQDLNDIMAEQAHSAQMVGKDGTQALVGYNQMMLRLAGSAKAFGVNTQEVIGIVNNLKDPFRAVWATGGNMFGTLEDRTKGVSDTINELEKDMKGMSAEERRMTIGIYTQQGLLGEAGINTIEQYERLSPAIRDAMGDQKKLQESMSGIFKEAADPEAEMKKNLQDTSTIIREQAIAVEKVITQLQEKLSGVLDRLEAMLNKFNGSTMAQTTTAWGVMGTAGVGAFLGILKTIGDVGMAVRGLRDTFGLLGKIPGLKQLGGLLGKIPLIGKLFDKGAATAVGDTFTATLERFKLMQSARMPGVANLEGITTATSKLPGIFGTVSKGAQSLMGSMQSTVSSSKLLSLALNPATLAIAAIAASAYYFYTQIKMTKDVLEELEKTNAKINEDTATTAKQLEATGVIRRKGYEDQQKQIDDMLKMQEKTEDTYAGWRERLLGLSVKQSKYDMMSAEEKNAYNTKLAKLNMEKKQKQDELNKKMTADEKKADQDKLMRFNNLTEEERKKWAAESEQAKAAEKAAGKADKASEDAVTAPVLSWEEGMKQSYAKFGILDKWAKGSDELRGKSSNAMPDGEAGGSFWKTVKDITSRPKVTPIVTTKVTEDTGKSPTKRDETAAKVGDIRGDLKQIIDNKSVDSIVGLLQQFLPKMIDSGDTGLASVANRWNT